jgi:SulP family sulfate permease
MAGVGLIESLLTLNIIDEITEREVENKEAIAQGVANILSGCFLVWVAALCWDKALLMFLMVSKTWNCCSHCFIAFVMFGAGLEVLPMAALTGLMIMVAIGTFRASLKTLIKCLNQIFCHACRHL